jgi:hypothetical protein
VIVENEDIGEADIIIIIIVVVFRQIRMTKVYQNIKKNFMYACIKASVMKYT